MITLGSRGALAALLATLAGTPVSAEMPPPFEFRVFNQNGWSGPMTWSDTRAPEQLVVTTHTNYMPNGARSERLTLYFMNQTARADHCVAEYIETGRSDDGLVLTLSRAPENSCAKSLVTEARLRAVAAQRIEVELLDGRRVLASGYVQSRRRGYALTLPNPDRDAMIARRQAAANRAAARPPGASSEQMPNLEAIQGGPDGPAGIDLDEAHKAFREKYERENPQVAGVPDSLHGLFLVTGDGLMLEMFDNGRRFVGRIVQPNHFFAAAGLGSESNVIQGSYNGREGRLFSKRRSVLPAGQQGLTTRCGAMYGFNEVDFIRPVGEGRWSLVPGSETFCAGPRINVFSCELTSCGKTLSTDGRHEGTFLYSDRQIALAAAQRNKADDVNKTALQDQYDEMAAERRAQQAEQPPTPGYFERGGACGDLSCEEEDVNQLLIDLYW